MEPLHDLEVRVASRYPIITQPWNLPLIWFEPGRLYDKFIGQSEKNLERALLWPGSPIAMRSR
jgi:hypothetical protein